MRALLQSERGDPAQVLRLAAVDEPAVGAGQVLVQVLASPIDPADLLTVRGLYPLLPELPWTPGMEGVGEVLTGEQAGLRVVLPVRTGAWRERVVLDEAALEPVPKGLDPVQACMSWINAPTAWRLLEGLRPGDVVISAPGAGGVGQLVAQLAALRGLHVVAVCRREAPELEGLAGVVLDGPGLGRRVRDAAGGPIVRLLDGVGGTWTARLARCLAPGAEVVVYGGMSRQAPELGIGDLVFRGLTMRGFWLYADNQARADRGRPLRAQLAAMVGLGLLRHPVASVHALDDWEAALEAARDPARRGRVVLCP